VPLARFGGFGGCAVITLERFALPDRRDLSGPWAVAFFSPIGFPAPYAFWPLYWAAKLRVENFLPLSDVRFRMVDTSLGISLVGK